MDVVLKLRELRKLKGLSQRDAARRAGVGEKSISSFETGDRISSMKLSQLERMLHAYGVTMQEFFGGEVDRMLAPWEAQRTREEEEVQGLMDELRALPKKTRSTMLRRMRLMLEASHEMPAVAAHDIPARGAESDWHLLTSRN